MVSSTSSPSYLNPTDFGGRIVLMKLVIGLGNPGRKYSKNRHNLGFLVVDRLVEELRVEGYGLQHQWKKSAKGKLQYIWFETKGERLELIKPQIFMNKSGISVAYAYKNHPELKHNDFYIIHDDLDLHLGNYKIQKGKGPREHKGLLSIYESLGTKNFWHVRVGVDNRGSLLDTNHRTPNTPRLSGEAYVLQDFTEEEMVVIRQVIDKIVEELIEQLR